MSEKNPGKRTDLTRRQFIASTGGAAATLIAAPAALGQTAAAASPSAATAEALVAPTATMVHGAIAAAADITSSPMGRIFPGLPAYTPDDQPLVDLAATIPDHPVNNPDNPTIPAGFTFLGQFIDHDITFDRTSLLFSSNDPNALTSARSANFDLDSLYGGGPSVSPQFYIPTDQAKLLLVNTTGVEDVPRQSSGVAIISDPRNDMHKIILQLHIAFIKFHNAIVDHLRSQGTSEDAVFSTAQQMVRWHYQWVVVNDFLRRTVGQTVVNQVLQVDAAGVPQVVTQFFHPLPDAAMMPVEFSVAAFRFGHSQVRHAYRVNPLRALVPILSGPSGLVGGSPLTLEHKIDWGNFFNLPSSAANPQPSKRIDGKISLPLRALPPEIIEADLLIRNLAERNLRRGKALGLPSGQAVAAAMGAQVLTNAQIGLTDSRFNDEAPLWFYILKEAELQQQGRRLGQVGARIVAEVILGVMASDSGSYLHASPAFVPAPPIAPAVGTFTFPNFLTFAGAA